MPKALAEDFRPFFHVVMKVKTRPASSSGNQPPSATLMMFAPKNARSMTRKNAASDAGGQRVPGQIRRARREEHRRDDHRRVTATPYAAASCVELRKPTTRRMHPIISAQFTDGM